VSLVSDVGQENAYLAILHPARRAAVLSRDSLRKHPRAAKKKVKKGYASGKEVRQHVATARVLKGQKIT
jgi:hypothetical protein